jgi:hypothetical protein
VFSSPATGTTLKKAKMKNNSPKQWQSGLMAAIAGCLLTFSLNSTVVAADPQEAIDQNRARELYQKAKKGEKLSAEDQAYLNRAKAAHRQGQGSDMAKSGEKRETGAGTSETAKASKTTEQTDVVKKTLPGAETIQKPTPTGIWLLAFAYSPRHPDMLDKLSASPCWANPNVDGIVLRADWGQIEPTEGQIDWSYFDRGFELAKKHNKQIEIIIIGGKFSPEWVYASGTQKFNFRGMQDRLYSMPIPWDPVLREKFGAMIKKVGQRYDSSPYLSLVTMTGFARAIDAWFAGPTEMKQYNAIGGNAKWLEGAKWFAALYNQAFPTTPFLISMCAPSRDDEGRTTIQKFVEDCVKEYGGRFGFYATSLVPKAKPDNAPLSYQYVKKFSDQAVTGLEMLGPLRPSQGPLKAALDAAIALKAQFVHIYEPELIDPKQQPVLAEARTQLKRYQLRAEGKGQ